MWLLIFLLASHLHTYGELSINYCERRLKEFFFPDNHLAFLSHVQILHAFIIQIFLWSLLGLAEKIVIQIWKLFKTREVTHRGWSGTEVVSECSIKYSFKPRDENDFFGGKKSLQGGSSCVKAQRAEKFGRKLLALTYAITWYIMHSMTKTFMAFFALAENLLTSTTLLIFMSSYRLVGFFFHGQTSV